MAKTTEKPEAQLPQSVNVEVLASHYQKTFEVAYEYWKERNRLFVFLVIAAGIGLLIILRVPEAPSLLVDAIAKFLGIDDPLRKTQLYTTFPFDVLLSMILVAMFYLMQRLYSTNLSVMRHYLYLGAVEKEIRDNLNLPPGSISFTREGKYYWDRRMIMQTASKWYYIFVLFVILIPFIVLKLQADWLSQNWLIILVDFTVSLMTFLYWAEYSYSAFRFDVPKIPTEKPKA
jgi:hypothetical protein